MSQHIADRLHAPGPKRMLALDGGGTRGIISIAFLQHIERTLQVKLKRGDDFVLADYFDLVGGTSVGAMLATMVALGWRADRIAAHFRGIAGDIFKRRLSLFQPYSTERLSKRIREVVGNEPLSSALLKTGLAIVTKRSDTNSVWVFTNNPASRHWLTSGASIGNADYALHDIIRASTAAPLHFPPKDITIHSWREAGQERAASGWFLDGGVSPHNNPALQFYLLAASKGYNLGGAPLSALLEGRGRGWALGAENLFILSVGAGSHRMDVRPSWLPHSEAPGALTSIIADTERLALTLLQGMGRCGARWTIDGEIGDLAGDNLADLPRLSFQRYDLPLDAAWLRGEGSGVVAGPHLKSTIDDLRIRLPRDLMALRRLVNVPAIGTLHAMAEAAALDQVSEAHFPDAFDKVWAPLGRVALFT